MTLIKSISGIRGTIGGAPGDNFTPVDIVSFTSSYGAWLLQSGKAPLVVVGRDGRMSGEWVSQLVTATLRSLGISVLDLGLSTTPTVEMAVPLENAGGGIILTASHNPRQWNALKLLNDKGEFLSQADAEAFMNTPVHFAEVQDAGEYRQDPAYIHKHIDKILELPLVDVEAIRERGFKIVVDAINSSGAIAVPALLERLGCTCILINGEPNGRFAHNPEPLPEHLTDLCNEVNFHKADLGIAVDPDVDRLALVCETGDLFGEEYTLVAVADYVLSHRVGATVSNLSSTRALRDITLQYGGQYFASAVGEVHVVAKMKETQAVIGGEGNGGIIYPDLHYGRDALVGIALFLSHLAKSGVRASIMRRHYPNYTISKNKMELDPNLDLDHLLVKLREKYRQHPTNTEDGLKIDFEEGWIHLRKSNTEPIIRIYTESNSEVIADNLARKIKADIQDVLRTNGQS